MTSACAKLATVDASLFWARAHAYGRDMWCDVYRLGACQRLGLGGSLLRVCLMHICNATGMKVARV